MNYAFHKFLKLLLSLKRGKEIQTNYAITNSDDTLTVYIYNCTYVLLYVVHLYTIQVIANASNTLMVYLRTCIDSKCLLFNLKNEQTQSML